MDYMTFNWRALMPPLLLFLVYLFLIDTGWTYPKGAEKRRYLLLILSWHIRIPFNEINTFCLVNYFLA